MFALGGQRFGVIKEGISLDHWIMRFYEWAATQKPVAEA